MTDFDSETAGLTLFARAAGGCQEATRELMERLIPIASSAVAAAHVDERIREDVTQDILASFPLAVPKLYASLSSDSKLSGFFYLWCKHQAWYIQQQTRYRRFGSLDLPNPDGKESLVASLQKHDLPYCLDELDCFICGKRFHARTSEQITCNKKCSRQVTNRIRRILALTADLHILIGLLRGGLVTNTALAVAIPLPQQAATALTLLRALGYDIKRSLAGYRLNSEPTDTNSKIESRIVKWQFDGGLVRCWHCEEYFRCDISRPRSTCSKKCESAFARPYQKTRADRTAARLAVEFQHIINRLSCAAATDDDLLSIVSTKRPIQRITLLRAIGVRIELRWGDYHLIEPPGIDLETSLNAWLRGEGAGTVTCISCGLPLSAGKRSAPPSVCGSRRCISKLSRNQKAVLN